MLSNVLAWGLVGVLAYFVWPSSLGGGTTAIVVNGESMEPTYHTGDIVIARSGEPAVGDVVVYTSEELGDGKIVHRVIGGDARSGWVLQGDNNDFIDPIEPVGDDVLGVARVHLPSIGAWAGALQSPIVWGSLLLVALALLIWPSRPCPETGDAETPAPESADSARHGDASRAGS